MSQGLVAAASQNVTIPQRPSSEEVWLAARFKQRNSRPASREFVQATQCRWSCSDSKRLVRGRKAGYQHVGDSCSCWPDPRATELWIGGGETSEAGKRNGGLRYQARLCWGLVIAGLELDAISVPSRSIAGNRG